MKSASRKFVLTWSVLTKRKSTLSGPRIDALRGPEWDREILNAVHNALNAKRYDQAGELMAGLEEIHLADASIPAAARLVRIRQLRAAIALVGGDAKSASEHIEAAAGVIAPLDAVDALEFRNRAAMHFQDYGKRIGGDGIVEAIQMYRRNLEQLNRETLPEAWAETQHNLGNALLLHGMHAGDPPTISRRNSSLSGRFTSLHPHS